MKRLLQMAELQPRRVARDPSRFSFENVFGTEIGADKHLPQIVIDPSVVVAKSEDLRCKKS
jgi:hypothetical protein